MAAMKTVVVFILGVLTGAIALFLYLQTQGQLSIAPPTPRAAGSSAPARVPVPIPASPTPAEPIATPADEMPRFATSTPEEEIPRFATSTSDVLRRLGDESVAIPVAGVTREALRDSFSETRGSRRHDALDILAPRGSPVIAMVAGRIRKLFLSDAGGITIYQVDPREELIYYYAHLDRYAPGIVEGKIVRKGEVLGFVGSTGNASMKAPHLHFSISQLPPTKEWWKGTPINPYPILVARGITFDAPSSHVSVSTR